MQTQQMIAPHPHVKGDTNDALIGCLEECYSCTQTCTSCAAVCLGEQMVQQLTRCIRLNLDCADVCGATRSVATLRTGSNQEVIRHMLMTRQTACRLCGAECERHAGHH